MVLSTCSKFERARSSSKVRVCDLTTSFLHSIEIVSLKVNLSSEIVFSPYADTISIAVFPSCVIGLAQETGPLSKTRLARRSRTDSRLLSTRWYSTKVLRFYSLILIFSPTWKSVSKTG